MLRFLLDSHIGHDVGAQVRMHRPECDIVGLAVWRNGVYRTASDHVILRAAHNEERTLVTYDVRTVTPLLRQWAMVGQAHAGVIFCTRQSLPQEDAGRQVRALIGLWDRHKLDDWRNATVYLR